MMSLHQRSNYNRQSWQMYKLLWSLVNLDLSCKNFSTIFVFKCSKPRRKNMESWDWEVPLFGTILLSSQMKSPCTTSESITFGTKKFAIATPAVHLSYRKYKKIMDIQSESFFFLKSGKQLELTNKFINSWSLYKHPQKLKMRFVISGVKLCTTEAKKPL